MTKNKDCLTIYANSKDIKHKILLGKGLNEKIENRSDYSLDDNWRFILGFLHEFPFTYKNLEFPNIYCALSYDKLCFFTDKQTADKCLDRKIENIKRKLRAFHLNDHLNQRWKEKEYDCLKNIYKAKINECDELKQVLLDTLDAKLFILNNTDDKNAKIFHASFLEKFRNKIKNQEDIEIKSCKSKNRTKRVKTKKMSFSRKKEDDGTKQIQINIDYEDENDMNENKEVNVKIEEIDENDMNEETDGNNNFEEVVQDDMNEETDGNNNFEEVVQDDMNEETDENNNFEEVVQDDMNEETERNNNFEEVVQDDMNEETDGNNNSEEVVQDDMNEETDRNNNFEEVFQDDMNEETDGNIQLDDNDSRNYEDSDNFEIIQEYDNGDGGKKQILDSGFCQKLHEDTEKLQEGSVISLIDLEKVTDQNAMHEINKEIDEIYQIKNIDKYKTNSIKSSFLSAIGFV
jgi:hypothetical protein